jgi:putative nucleotidyltransferase with HDIG domain
MSKSATYQLALNGMLLFSLASATSLVAPQTVANLYEGVSAAWVLLFGFSLYLVGALLNASVLLNFPKEIHSLVQLLSSVSAASLAYLYFQHMRCAEGIWLCGLAIGFLLSIRWTWSGRDWLAAAATLVNLFLGLCIFFRRDLVAPTLGNASVPFLQAAYGIAFLSSALIGLLLLAWPKMGKNGQVRLLSVPWFMWAGLSLVPFDLPNLVVSGLAALSLASLGLLPWSKVVLQNGGQKIGGRFFILNIIAQVIFLGFTLWILYAVEYLFAGAENSIQYMREIALWSYLAIGALGLLVVSSINLSINGVYSGLTGQDLPPSALPNPPRLLKQLREALLEPFYISRTLLLQDIQQKQEYERLLHEHIATEKRRMAQLNLLHQLNLELENVYDPPVSAQLTANAIQHALGGSLTVIMSHDPERNELVVMAASGPGAALISPGYRQGASKGLVGRAARLRRTQLASDTRLDSDYFSIENQACLSEMVVPVLHYNQLRGAILVDHPEAHAFDDSDIRTLETVAILLVTSWERSDHDQRLMQLIQAGVTLSTTLEVEAVIKEIADITQKTLDARFVFAALVDKGGGFTRVATAGYAPTLTSILGSDPGGNTLIQAVLNNATPLRLRDVRKKFSSTPTGSADLRTLLAAPVRLRQSSIGVILAFGKIGNTAFTERDEALSSLLASQAAAAIETTWLYQELRSMFNIATQLYQLSTRVIQAEQLTDAASAIAETTYQVSRAQAAGIVLHKSEDDLEVCVQIDANGLHPGSHHPMELIQQAMESGQNIIVSGSNELARVCIPLQTPRKQYGALWVDVPEKNWFNSRYSDNLHTLANQAAIALERSILLSETRKQALELEEAYRELEITYDQTLAALSSALDARDRETEGHSLRVALIAAELGQRMGMNPEQAKTLERGAILHDIGKIGISDSILLKPGSLTKAEWQIMRQHPDIGARIIEEIPFLQDTLPVIRYHQERWDGSGYPIGLRGAEIPLVARIFAVVDAFDALTNDRPYRKRVPAGEALEYIKSQAGVLFDPQVVESFEKMIQEDAISGMQA